MKIPIAEAKKLAKKYNYEQIIILGLNKSTEKKNWYDGWGTSYNKDKKRCKFLGKITAILAYNLRAFYSGNEETVEEYLKKIQL